MILQVSQFSLLLGETQNKFNNRQSSRNIYIASSLLSRYLHLLLISPKGSVAYVLFITRGKSIEDEG